jgi:hypothetical protein
MEKMNYHYGKIDKNKDKRDLSFTYGSKDKQYLSFTKDKWLSFKEWEKVLWWLWSRFGIYEFKISSILDKRIRRWVYHLTNWGRLTRKARGVYYINKSGMRQIFKMEGKL